MSPSLKPLSGQVIVITGASSGIGLATAQRAAARGARVVLSARNGAALEQAAADIRAKGGKAIAVVADVSSRENIQSLADQTIATYGGFDTWVNNAGTSIFGRLEQISDEDHRRLFDVNFWGVVYGTTTAYAHLKAKGGAIVTVGSIAGDVALPIQGMYSATKHAIKGFTDAFRMETEAAGAPVSITQIKPASIDTPLPRHAKNYLDQEPTLPPPIYAPEDVANAILYAAERGGRDYYVGGGGKLISSLNKHIPSAVDRLGPQVAALSSSGPARRDRRDALYEPGQDGAVHGDRAHFVRRSVYTNAQTNPLVTTALVMAGMAGFALLGRSSRS